MQPCGSFDIGYKKSMAVVKTRLQWLLLLGFLVMLFTIPLFVNPVMLSVLNMMGITLIAVLGVQVLTGYCGQINIGQAAFVGVGAYTSAILMTEVGLPFLVCLPCAGLMAGLAGLLVGSPSLRVKGFYLALATVAALMIFQYIVIGPAYGITGGMKGYAVPPASFGSLVLDSEQSMYFLIMTIAIILVAFVKNLTRLKVGRAFIAIRDNDIAAEAAGINVFRYKLLAFFICSAYAGIAGSLMAHYIGRTSPEYFTLIDSIWYLGMIIIGGLGSITGAIFGVIFVRGIEELVNSLVPQLSLAIPAIPATASAALGLMVVGLMIILFLIFEPRGLYHRLEMFKAYYRLWPFSY